MANAVELLFVQFLISGSTTRCLKGNLGSVAPSSSKNDVSRER